VHSDGALGIGNRRFFCRQIRERPFQTCERDSGLGFSPLLFFATEITTVKGVCQSLMQPRWNAACRHALDQRVGELMSEHALELRAVLQRALHRDAYVAVELASSPGRRSSDVAELIACVKDHRDDAGWIRG